VRNGGTVRALLAAVVLAVLSAGCASSVQGAGSAAPTAAATVAPTPGDPDSLIGNWLVDAPGVAAGTVLHLAQDMNLWSSCGVYIGGWSADVAGLFVGTFAGESGGCTMTLVNGSVGPTWLTRVVAFAAKDNDVRLLDSGGSLVATLRPGGRPTPGPDIASSEAAPPVVTQALRDRFTSPSAVPPGLVAATPSQLIGYWVSAASPTLRGFAELRADGSWGGSDGANSSIGRWSAAPDGQLVTSQGAQTAVGCAPGECADVEGWFASAARAAFDGTTLVLLRADGSVVGRAVKGSPPPPEAPISPGAPAVGSLGSLASLPGVAASSVAPASSP
jgi:hypothetical protein